MKYRPSAALVSLLARSIAESTITLFSEHSWDSITAVPSSKESFLERGFNPALQIAKHIKLKLKHTRLEPNLLQHRGSAAQQASLASSKRIENVRNSFAANANKVHGREILLVDDVVTTGATSTACALALLDAGAAQVDLFSLCRSGAWREQRHEIYQRFKGSASLAC